MPYITYPWHVKHNGTDYAPGQLIEVEDAAEYVRGGAVVAARDAPKQPGRPRRKKTDRREGGDANEPR